MVASSFFVSTLLLAAGALAQNSNSGSSDQSGDGNLVSVQVVQVSDQNATLRYYPEDIKAEPGSMVQFQFYPKMHTVTQSTFDQPCQPINKVMSNVTGISSGPLPPQNGMMKVFTIMINDTKPIWMYCATQGHCQKGMAMVINAPANNPAKTIAAYKAAAAKVLAANSTANGTANGTGNGSPVPGAASSFKTMVGSTAMGAFMVAGFALLL